MTDIVERLRQTYLAWNNPLSHELDILLLAADEIERLREENKRLREAGGYMLGWHPTDPEHPAFHDTQEYGQRLMNEILSGVKRGES